MAWRISQSLVKHYREYRAGLTCGLAFAAEYIFKDPDFQLNKTSSEEMKAGAWFEYRAFGGTPVYGPLPTPSRVSRGDRKGELKAEYMYAEEQAEALRQTLEHYGFKNMVPGVEIKTDHFGGVVSHLDLEAEDLGETRSMYGKVQKNPDYGSKVIIDLKYSGLLNNRWEKMGWDLFNLPDKHYLMVQALHYTWHYWKAFDKIVPYYFYVASSKNGYDKKFIRVNMDHETIFANYENELEQIRAEIELAEISGFTPRPSPSNCYDCPIRFKCPKRTNIPEIETVDYLG